MRLLNVMPIVLAGLVACRGDWARGRVDSSRAHTLRTPAVATSPSSEQAAMSPPSSVDDARAVCDTVALRWRKLPWSNVAVRDTVANPVNHDHQHHERPDELLPPTPGCVVYARIDSGRKDNDYWPAPDWAMILPLSADGPDGNMMTYQRGMVRCQVSNSWDGEHDDDTTYVPQKWSAQQTTCWRHNRTLIASDTTNPSS